MYSFAPSLIAYADWTLTVDWCGVLVALAFVVGLLGLVLGIPIAIVCCILFGKKPVDRGSEAEGPDGGPSHLR